MDEHELEKSIGTFKTACGFLAKTPNTSIRQYVKKLKITNPVTRSEAVAIRYRVIACVGIEHIEVNGEYSQRVMWIVLSDNDISWAKQEDVARTHGIGNSIQCQSARTAQHTP